MAYSSYQFSLSLVGACLLVFCSGRASREDATLAPPKASSLVDSNMDCDINIARREADCGFGGFNDVPQDLPKDIKRLILSGNNITSLLNSTFRRYALINNLDLSSNDIRMIEPATFYPLKHLRILVMSHNPHLVLPHTGLLRWAGNLIMLDVSNSNLESLPNDILKWSRQVQTLELSRNKISAINISSCGSAIRVYLYSNEIENLTKETFVFACQTVFLRLGLNPIILVDPNVIASLDVKSLTLDCDPSSEVLRNIILGVSGSLIKELIIRLTDVIILPKDLFYPLRDYHLSLLKFTYNSIKDLYPYVFSDLTQLDQLNLDGNKIAMIEPFFFEGMQKLRNMSLNNNEIEYINGHGISWSIDLYELHLTGNDLTEISPFAFLGLKNLTTLNLNSNRGLAVLNLAAFTGLYNLRTLNLSYCSISSLGLYTPMLQSLHLDFNDNPILQFKKISFTNAQSLLYLYMSRTGFSGFELCNSHMQECIFNGLLNLTYLDLSGNHFDKFHGGLNPRTFQKLSALKHLDLNDCDISYLHPHIFVGLESLQKLELARNYIYHLHYNLLHALPQVLTINLGGNRLAYLKETIFSNNSKLEDLSLANNRFPHLNYTTFLPIKSTLSYLDLSMNPIDYNCDLKWLPEWLHGKLNLVDKQFTICSMTSLVPFRDKLLSDFDPSELCRHNIVPYCMIPLVAVCLIVICILIYHNRWPLKHKLFLLKLAAIGYKEIRDARDHNDYEFDINIIFYDEDDEWIREQLRPALQEHLPHFQRNIFGDEDLVLGMHYLDSVDYVVTHSYKTIIVLSRASVSDRWFMLKFRTAMDHVSDTGTEFVVVVFLEDIPEEEIPFLARLYLSDGRPYLYWPEDVRGHDYFWNELAHKLTINLRTNDLIPNE